MVSAKLMSSVSLNLSGLLVAVAVMAAPSIVLGQTLDNIAKRKPPGYLAKFILIFPVTCVWLIAQVPVADLASSGFNIHGAWPTIETIVTVFAVGLGLGGFQLFFTRRFRGRG
jgi:hypothetical protein